MDISIIAHLFHLFCHHLILSRDTQFLMGSLDDDSLFTKIRLEEAIYICANTMSENKEKIEGLSKIEFKELLSLATKEPFFIFNGKLYKQTNRVAMGLPLGPTVANTSLAYFEKNWLQNCPSDFKHHYYRRYVDDIFVLLT